MNTADLNIKDLTYQIQSNKIAMNAIPRVQLPPKKSISKVDTEMIQEYNKQFEKIKEVKVPVINGMTGLPELDENGEVVMTTKNYKYFRVPDFVQTQIPELIPVVDDQELDNMRFNEKSIFNNLLKNNAELKALEDQKKILNYYFNIGSLTPAEMNEKKRVLDRRTEVIKRINIFIEIELREYENILNDNTKNITTNESLIDATKKSNLQKWKNYFEEMNLLNSGSFNTERLVNETEDEYYTRLYNNAQEENVDELILKAKTDNNKKFKEILKQLFRDDVKIESVNNIIDDDVKLNIIKKNVLFKEKFIKLYGENNKNITVENIIEFCDAFNKAMSGDDAILNYLTTPKPTLPENMYSREINYKIINNMLVISIGEKSVYFKVLDTLRLEGVLSLETIKQIVYSFTGQKGSFVPYFTKKVEYIKEDRKKGDPHYIELLGEQAVMEHLLIPNAKLREIIGGVRETKILAKLFSLGLIPEYLNTKNLGQVQFLNGDKVEVFGWGIHNEEIPDEVSFGSLKLKLNKLFYKNFLSLVDKNGINIPSFKQVKVSDDFVKLIMNITKNKFPSKNELENLNQNERNLFDRIIHLAKLHKNPNLEKKMSGSIQDELKNQLSLIEQDINAGNNNKEMVRDMEKILMNLVDYGCITYANAKKHIKQYM
jgi:hypothetical protein